jgi:hypothetical protein
MICLRDLKTFRSSHQLLNITESVGSQIVPYNTVSYSWEYFKNIKFLVDIEELEWIGDLWELQIYLFMGSDPYTHTIQQWHNTKAQWSGVHVWAPLHCALVLCHCCVVWVF